MLQRIIRDMSEGVMTFGRDGTVLYVNPAAEKILNVKADEITKMKFAKAFIRYEENDAFNQAILDAAYAYDKMHESLVPYFNGKNTRQLHIVCSFLKNEDENVGGIVVIGDITELAELKIKYAEQITELLNSLVRALSTAIDERSHYNANHTKNMVRMGKAFLEWLEAADNEWKFSEDEKRSFIMSVWLHDIGKLAVPLAVMDKADRLAGRLDDIVHRFDRVRLLNKIAFLENRCTLQEMQDNNKTLQDVFDFVCEVNKTGFMSDEKLSRVQALSELSYEDEDGSMKPLFTQEELTALSVRKGTLTAAEREIMQSHAIVTGRILSQVTFPDDYSKVPLWASSHHELLNGKGYPSHLTGKLIPDEVRLLTILDIFEALTAKDRPYKPPMSVDKAFAVLHSMADEGAIDGNILELFESSRAWEVIL